MRMACDGQMLLHPEYEALRKEAERLKEELARLSFEKDHLLFQLGPRLEAEYMLKVGGLEYRAYELECRAARLRRKAALIRARLNRRQTVRLDEVEAQLDEEFAEYRRRLKERLDALEDALRRHESARPLPERDTAELRRLYRQAIKCLHPDLNPNDTAERAEERARLPSASK